MQTRVLQVVTKMDRGGLETMLMNYYRHIDRNVVQFDFLVHRIERGAYDDEIEQLGGKIYRLPHLNPISPSYRQALRTFFAEHPEYNCIHVHQDCMSAIVLSAAKKAGIPVRIAHSHSSNQDRNLKYPIKLFYRRKIAKNATTLFACGKAAGDWMFCGAEYQIIRNAIDAARYVPNFETRDEVRKKLNLQNAFVIGNVGRFSPPKNHPFLLEIFAALLKKAPTAVLLLVGDGDGMQQAKQIANRLGILSHVQFLGIRSDISELMQAMDVFVFPSLYEGLPVTMVEAQAAGLPCLISDKVPPECIITDGLVDIMPLSASTDAWATQILKWHRPPRNNHYEEIAAHGFDIKNEAQKLQTFYLEAVR